MGVINTSQSFANGDSVTSTKLNNITAGSTFDSTAVSGTGLTVTAGGLLSLGTVASSNMGNNSVLAGAIADGVITNAKISASAAIDLSKLATGALPSAITVASANIVDGTIATADIANANITAAKLDGAQPSGPPIYGARAWACFQSNGTIVSTGGNVSSITNPSAGQYSVTFTTAMPNANYAIVINAGGLVANEAVNYASVTSRTVSGFSFVVARATNGSSSGYLANMTSNGSLVVFG